MDTPLVKGIIIGVSLFLLVAVLTITLFAFNIGQDSSKSATQELNTVNTDMKEQKLLVYDNMEMSGSQVMNSIKKMENDGKGNKIGIQVKTGANTGGVWYYNTFTGGDGTGTLTAGNGEKTLSKAYDTSNQTNYINPSGNFTGKILRDNNNTIRAVIFTQDNVK